MLVVGGGCGDVDLIRLRFCLTINGVLLLFIVKFPLGVLVFSKIDLKSSSSSCSYFNGVVDACSFNFFRICLLLIKAFGKV